MKKFNEFLLELEGVPAINLKQKELKALEDKLTDHETGGKELSDKEISEIRDKIKVLKGVIKNISKKVNEGTLKFEEFVNESTVNEELHLIVTSDTEEQDEYGTEYSLKKGDKLVINDIKDGEAAVNFKGKKLFIDEDDLKSFTKKAA